MSRTAKRRGFTLIELLVVIFIIGVLIALLLPAIQSARESARRLTCSNNLKQIALALHVYAEAHSEYLPAYWRTQDKSRIKAERRPYITFGWRVETLPSLEKQNLYDQFDFTRGPYDPVNIEATATPMPIFQCPSTPRTVTRFVDQEMFAKAAGSELDLSPLIPEGLRIPTFDYRGFARMSLWKGEERIKKCAWFGALGRINHGDTNRRGGGYTQFVEYDIPSNLARITDGLSNTILLSEQVGAPTPLPKEFHEPDLNAMSLMGGPWATGDGLAGMDDTYIRMPINENSRRGLYSFHTGVYTAMCDGAVVFLSEETEMDVVIALMSRAGGERVEVPR